MKYPKSPSSSQTESSPPNSPPKRSKSSPQSVPTTTWPKPLTPNKSAPERVNSVTAATPSAADPSSSTPKTTESNRPFAISPESNCARSSLNLLQLAPGGHMGRFCVWSQSAMEALDKIYGEDGKRIPTANMTNADLARIINSDEIQSVLNPAKAQTDGFEAKANPLRSIVALEKLDRHAANKRRMSQKAEKDRESKKGELLAKKRAARTAKKAHTAQGKAFIAVAAQQGDVCADGFNIE